MLALGCLGAVVGSLLGVVLLAVGAVLAMGSAPGEPFAQPATANADIRVIVQESYFNAMVAKAVPQSWQGNLEMDLQPGNRIAIGGRVTASIFGQDIEGDVSGTVGIAAQDGLIVLTLEDVEAFGFSLASLGQTFTADLWQDVSEIVNQQVRNGLGEGAQVLAVTTDDTTLTLEAALP